MKILGYIKLPGCTKSLPGVRMAIRRNAPTARMMSRQMACAQAEDGKEDDDVDAQPGKIYDLWIYEIHF